MAGTGPAPKNPAQRRRRNRTPGARVLSAEVVVPQPSLPDMDWHPLTQAWWRDIWRSPMAQEYDQSDIHGLLILAVLVDQFWQNPSKDMASEIRLQRQSFGLSPIDRRRLAWEIERAEQAQEEGQRRRAAKAAPAGRRPDPRLAYGPNPS